MREFFADLTGIFRRAFRLVTFRVPLAEERPERAPAVLAILALAMMAAAGLEALVAGENRMFNPFGLGTQVADWGLLAALLLLFYARAQSTPVLRALADVGAISILHAILQGLIQLLLLPTLRKGGVPDYELWLVHTLYTGLALLFVLAVIWHAGRFLTPEHVRLAGLRLLAASLLPSLLIPQQPLFYGFGYGSNGIDVWSVARAYWSTNASDEVAEDDDAETTAFDWSFDYEKVLYDQPKLVDQALAAVSSSAGGPPRYYFVAAATDSSSEVFRREALGAKAAFNARFGTEASSLALINQWQTASQTPLASLTNLDRLLNGIGKRMDVEKDVLVLFITAHGGKEVLSVNVPGFPLNQITPERLAEILDGAGIRNRVLIISACYSGSFIPKLAGPNTLIMTAASGETTSFGCSNEREWTYFGDAFFNRALKETASLMGAFDKAKVLIETWESEQGLTPSKPQISVGAGITDLLASIDGAFGPRADAGSDQPH